MALDVYLTNACNLHCKYCFNMEREDAPRIPLKDVCDILEAAYQNGHRYISITGGEPFLYKKIFEVIEFAHNLGFWINILTHGGLFNQEKVDKLKKYWRLRVRISLDGPNNKTHDLLRGEGTFNNTINKIKLLVSNGINVGIGVTVSENNLSSMDQMFTLCLENKVNFVRFTPVARVKKGKSANITESLHVTLLQKIIELTLANKDRVELSTSPTKDIPISINALTTRRCMAGKLFFGVTPDKKILPCPLLIESQNIKTTIFKDQSSFDTVTQQMDTLFSEIKPQLEGICQNCEFNTVCYGGCLAEKLSFDRNLHSEQPICTKKILESLTDKYSKTDIEQLVASWLTQMRSSLEDDSVHACMRHSPFWSVNFKMTNEWKKKYQ